MNLANLLCLPSCGLVCVIGSGGKTSLLQSLGTELSQDKKVIICATTKMYPPKGIPLLLSPTELELAEAFESNSLICAGDILDNGKLTLDKTKIDILLDYADYVIAEADGSAGLPLKAHAEYEPVIPDKACFTVLVAGIDGIGQPIEKTVHRPEIYSGILKCGIDHVVTPEDAAKVINAEGYGDVVFINKADTQQLIDKAEQMASYLNKPAIIASLKQGSANKYAGTNQGRR